MMNARTGNIAITSNGFCGGVYGRNLRSSPFIEIINWMRGDIINDNDDGTTLSGVVANLAVASGASTSHSLTNYRVAIS